jgi:caffeoyl-CoA O-methyltransferase
MKTRYISLNDNLFSYICKSSSNANDALVHELQEKTHSLGDISRMQIGADQALFLTILAAATGVKRALEIGTFTGLSSLSIARGLPSDGKLICLDQSKEWTDIARAFWKKGGVDQKIELKLGDAIPLIKTLPKSPPLDLVFIDADKAQYDAYFEAVLPMVRTNGLILFDNMLWGGKLGQGDITDADGRALESLNRKLATDPRVESVLLSVGDGIQFCRKK